MKPVIIEKLRIDCFGRLEDLELPLADGLTVVFGQNAAGKSTLFDFITRAFLGFTVGRAQRRYDISKGQHAGKLWLDLDGRKVQFTRVQRKGNSAGEELLFDDAGARVPLSDVLGGVSPDMFRQLFAVSCDEQREFAQLGDQGTAEAMMLGEGALELPEALETLKEEGAAARVELKRVLAELGTVRARLGAVRGSSARYAELAAHVQGVTAELDAAELGRKEAASRVALAERAARLAPHVFAARRARQALAALPDYSAFPPLAALGDLESQRARAHALSESARSRLDELKREVAERTARLPQNLPALKAALDAWRPLAAIDAGLAGREAAIVAAQEQLDADALALEGGGLEWLNALPLSAALTAFARDAAQAERDADAAHLAREREAVRAALADASADLDAARARAAALPPAPLGVPRALDALSRARTLSDRLAVAEAALAGVASAPPVPWWAFAAAAAPLALLLAFVTPLAGLAALLLGAAASAATYDSARARRSERAGRLRDRDALKAALLAALHEAGVSAPGGEVSRLPQLYERAELERKVADLGTRHERLAAQAARLGTRLGELQAAAEGRRAALDARLRELQLPAGLSAARLVELLELAGPLRQRSRELTERERLLTVDRVRCQHARAGLRGRDSAALEAQLERALADAARLDALTPVVHDAEATASACAAEAAARDEQLARVLTAAGAVDAADFAGKAEAARGFREATAALESATARVFEESRLSLDAALAAHDAQAEGGVTLELAREQLAIVEGIRDELLHELAGAKKELALLEDDRETAALKAQEAALAARVEPLAETWGIARLGTRMLEDGRERLKQRAQPRVVQLASALLVEMLGGEAERVFVDPDAPAAPRLIEKGGASLDVESREVSTSARELLYVAFRLAKLVCLADEQPALPVLLDDVFVNVDAVRLPRVARVLARFAAGRQVLLFTCHEHQAALMQAAGASVVRLATAAVPAAAPAPAPAARPGPKAPRDGRQLQLLGEPDDEEKVVDA